MGSWRASDPDRENFEPSRYSGFWKEISLGLPWGSSRRRLPLVAQSGLLMAERGAILAKSPSASGSREDAMSKTLRAKGRPRTSRRCRSPRRRPPRVSLSEAGGSSATRPELAIRLSYPLGERVAGYVTITPDRFWLLFFDSTRKTPAAATLTDAEAVASMKSHVAWTGKYSTKEQTPEGLELTAHVDAASVRRSSALIAYT